MSRYATSNSPAAHPELEYSKLPAPVCTAHTELHGVIVKRTSRAEDSMSSLLDGERSNAGTTNVNAYVRACVCLCVCLCVFVRVRASCCVCAERVSD